MLTTRPKKFFLDTCSLIALAGLQGRDLEDLRSLVERNKIELCISHVQVDEKYSKELSDYQQQIKEALKKFDEKGIRLSPLEATAEIVLDVSRFDYAEFGSEEVGRVDDELRKALKNCMGDKADDMNIARDALIAMSSLDHDYFITSDRCLYMSWKTVIAGSAGNRSLIEQEHQVPEIIWARAVPHSVAQKIIQKVSSTS